MTSEHQQWQKLKNNYLKQVEQSLAAINHPKSTDVLNDVAEHLDSKYAELYPESRTWETFQQIITEMGPPQEYAELLMEEKPVSTKNKFGLNEFLAVVFVVVLMGVGGYLIYTAQKTVPSTPVPPPAQTPTPAPIAKTFEFELDERALGKWMTVDFVKTIDDFDPAKKNWQGELFLKSLAFEDSGVLWWTNNNGGPYKHQWTKGKVDPLKERPAFYYLRNIDGQTYLFYEWISGDVTIRGREPSYYVLRPVADNETVIPSWFENDPQAIGYWLSVDFVKNIEDFQPELQHTYELFLKTLHFEDNGKLHWTIGKSKPVSLDWTKGRIRPFGIWPATYSIRSIKGNDYLFYEYRTKDSPRAGFYVFKHTTRPEKSEEQKDTPFENDPQALGQWVTVDFVETPEAFQPNQKIWQGKLFVKSLHFKEQGIVEWCLGEDQMEINHRWTKGKLIDDELSAKYFFEAYEDGDYIFMEWNSGDVTIRGQKPAYYVLKKTTATSEPRVKAAELESDYGILGKWHVVDCVKNIEDFNPDLPTYKKSLILKELHFTSPNIVYWNFNNDIVKETSYSENVLETVKGHQANYSLNVIEGQEYLFIEWITPEVVKERKEPDYYVLARPPQFCIPDDALDVAPTHNLFIYNQNNVNPGDTGIVGQWVSVDFVKTISDFQPSQKRWSGGLYLKGLTIYDDGTTSGPWTWRGNTLWHPGDKTRARLTIQSMQGATYLFMEWMSGDVTIRGRKPCYYVLKKTGTFSNDNNRKQKITFRADSCTADYVRSILGRPNRVDLRGRMLRYTDDGIDFLFSDNGPLSEVHLNQGYTGKLKTGVSLTSSKQEVFATYGQPIRIAQASDLHRKNDERILYQKGNISRIYYGRHGLIFWFKDDFINQIVVFKGMLVLE